MAENFFKRQDDGSLSNPIMGGNSFSDTKINSLQFAELNPNALHVTQKNKSCRMTENFFKRQDDGSLSNPIMGGNSFSDTKINSLQFAELNPNAQHVTQKNKSCRMTENFFKRQDDGSLSNPIIGGNSFGDTKINSLQFAELNPNALHVTQKNKSCRMAEKGFATIFGLCLILVIALVVKGIHAAETNHAYETANFQAEVELQNAADSALVEVADKILSGAETLPVKQMPYRKRAYYQREFKINKTSARLGDITVRVWGEETTVKPYKVNYATKKANRINNADVKGYVFFSMARANHGGRKIYRRAFAYVAANDETIHFMDLPSSEYNF